MSTSQIHNCLLPTDRAMVALHDACSQKFSAVQSNNLVTRNGLDRNYGLDTWLELLTCPCQRIYVSTTLKKKLYVYTHLIFWEAIHTYIYLSCCTKTIKCCLIIHRCYMFSFIFHITRLQLYCGTIYFKVNSFWRQETSS